MDFPARQTARAKAGFPNERARPFSTISEKSEEKRMLFDKLYEKANRKRIKHIARIDPAEHGEPAYLVAHKLTLENFREMNLAVSAPALQQDQKLKKMWGLLSFAVSLFFFVLCFFNLDYVKGDFWHLIWYSSLMSYLCAAALFFGIGFYSFFFYKLFFKRKLARATAEYYRTSKYLSGDMTLALYETGVLEKAAPRDAFFSWKKFQRCWATENVVYLEFKLANQLFVAKESIAAAGYAVEDFMAYANARIEAAKLEPDEDEELPDEELDDDELADEELPEALTDGEPLPDGEPEKAPEDGDEE